MRLGWPEFEKRIRQAHQAEVKASPEVRQRIRRARKRRAGSHDFGRRILFTVLIALVFASFAGRVRNIEFGLAIISLWTAGTVFRKTRQWFQNFYGSEDLLALNLLPISDEQIFRVQSRKFARQFSWNFCGLLLLYLALGIVNPQERMLILLAPVLALVQIALMFSLSLHAAVFLHSFPLGTVAGLFRTSAVFLLLVGSQIPAVIPYAIQFSYWFFPTGWVNYALVQSVFREDWLTLVLLVPVGALIYAGIYSWQRLRAFYSLEGFEIAPSPGMFGGSDDETSRRGATEIQDTIHEGGFLRGINWARGGWMEKLISRWLNGRDRLVLEFLVAEDPQWTRALRNSLWLFGFGLAVIYLFGQYSGLIVFLPAYLLATATLPLLGGEWRGLQQFPTGGVFLPAYAVYPVTFREITRVLLRVNFIRTLSAAPLLFVLGLLAAWKLGHPVPVGAEFTVKGLAIFLALQPLLVLMPLSRTTNDTSRMWLIWLLLFPLILLILAFSIAVFVLPGPLYALASITAILLVAALFHTVYRWAFHRNQFDLLASRATSAE